MTLLAKLHPEFAEEMALLPRETRIDLYALILMQGNPLADHVRPLHYFHPRDNRLFSCLQTRFHKFNGWKFCFDSRPLNEYFCYLHLAKVSEEDEEHKALVETAVGRLASLREGKVEMLDFQVYLEEKADREEYTAAVNINGEISRRGLTIELFKIACEETRQQEAKLFGLSKVHMESFETRFDHYLSTFRAALLRHGGNISLTISFSPDERFEFSGLKHMASLKGIQESAGE